MKLVGRKHHIAHSAQTSTPHLLDASPAKIPKRTQSLRRYQSRWKAAFDIGAALRTSSRLAGWQTRDVSRVKGLARNFH
jgi:hypothetical protein